MIILAKKRPNALPRRNVVLWFSMNEEYSASAIGFAVETVGFKVVSVRLLTLLSINNGKKRKYEQLI